MNLRRLIFLLAGILFHLVIYSQEIKLTASKKALNEVLLNIRDNYNVDFSFNDSELSKYLVNVSKTFANIDLALEYLLKDLPFEYQKTSGVYVIFPKMAEMVEKPRPKVYRISGRIMEAKTNEVLPFSNILVNSKGIISDYNGNFLFSTTDDSVFRIQISHLGYLVKDTIFYRAHKNISIFLTPSEQQLEEIEIREQLIEDFSSTENEPATLKLNH
ncbi:MAG: carboxypeptidase-like regulatory domain-containing protein, partial [Chloroflexia bacterium]|nr:carboxypeptidase-like regulatory domain-containing protein [Chloroflexia bacterium]